MLTDAELDAIEARCNAATDEFGSVLDFIAAARTDIPKLVATIRELKAHVDNCPLAKGTHDVEDLYEEPANDTDNA